MFALNPEDKTLKATFGRRAIEHGFSDKSLRAVEESLVEDVHIWCTHLGEGASDAERWTPPKDAQEWSSYLTYDMMSDMTYGKRVDYMGSDENRHVPGLVMAASKFMYTVSHVAPSICHAPEWKCRPSKWPRDGLIQVNTDRPLANHQYPLAPSKQSRNDILRGGCSPRLSDKCRVCGQSTGRPHSPRKEKSRLCS